MTQKLNIDIVARDKTKQALNNVQGALAKVKGAVFNLQNAFIGLGAGLVIRNLVSTGRELENLQVRLKFLLKDTNEGAKAFDNMVKFASRVPFSLEEIQSGSGILATVTDNAKDLQNMLEITGNVAAVTGLDFRTTAEQIQRSFSAGIGAADLFREKGVRNMLGFKAGAAVSIEETAKAFERVFGVGGRFGKATDELAKTVGTDFANAIDTVAKDYFDFNLKVEQEKITLQVDTSEATMTLEQWVEYYLSTINGLNNPVVPRLGGGGGGGQISFMSGGGRIPMYAKGGTLGSGYGIVGEAGPELFRAPAGGGMIDNKPGGGGVVINFNVEAIDRASFQGSLAENRSAIISLVNEAVNDSGRRSII